MNAFPREPTRPLSALINPEIILMLTVLTDYLYQIQSPLGGDTLRVEPARLLPSGVTESLVEPVVSISGLSHFRNIEFERNVSSISLKRLNRPPR